MTPGTACYYIKTMLFGSGVTLDERSIEYKYHLVRSTQQKRDTCTQPKPNRKTEHTFGLRYERIQYDISINISEEFHRISNFVGMLVHWIPGICTIPCKQFVGAQQINSTSFLSYFVVCFVLRNAQSRVNINRVDYRVQTSEKCSVLLVPMQWINSQFIVFGLILIVPLGNLIRYAFNELI